MIKILVVQFETQKALAGKTGPLLFRSGKKNSEVNVGQADMFRNYGCYCTPNGKGEVNFYLLLFFL